MIELQYGEYRYTLDKDTRLDIYIMIIYILLDKYLPNTQQVV